MYALPRELEVLRNAEHGQRIASLGTPGMKSGHVMSAAVAVQLATPIDWFISLIA